MKLNDMSDYERGEHDCLIGQDIKDNESPDYYSGYDAEFLKDASDKERGAIDCKIGFKALIGKSAEYDAGYAEQYAKEQTVGGQHNEII